MNNNNHIDTGRIIVTLRGKTLKNTEVHQTFLFKITGAPDFISLAEKLQNEFKGYLDNYILEKFEPMLLLAESCASRSPVITITIEGTPNVQKIANKMKSHLGLQLQ